MENKILKIYLKNNQYWADLPRGFPRFTKCFLTKSQVQNQIPDFRKSLNIGRDFQIHPGVLKINKPDLDGYFILVQIEKEILKNCLICRKENKKSAFFCTGCGSQHFI